MRISNGEREKRQEFWNGVIAVLTYVGCLATSAWCLAGFLYYISNPELTQMQVFKHMIGL